MGRPFPARSLARSQLSLSSESRASPFCSVSFERKGGRESLSLSKATVQRAASIQSVPRGPLQRMHCLSSNQVRYEMKIKLANQKRKGLIQSGYKSKHAQPLQSYSRAQAHLSIHPSIHPSIHLFIYSFISTPAQVSPFRPIAFYAWAFLTITTQVKKRQRALGFGVCYNPWEELDREEGLCSLCVCVCVFAE